MMKSIARRFKARQSSIPTTATRPTHSSNNQTTTIGSGDLSSPNISGMPSTQISTSAVKLEPAPGYQATSDQKVDQKVTTGEKSEKAVSPLSHSNRALSPGHPRVSISTQRTSRGQNSWSPPTTSSDSNSTTQNKLDKDKDTESEGIASDSHSKSAKASSSRTFGNDSSKKMAETPHNTLPEIVDTSEKSYTLKPITQETVYHHVTEEVQRVKQQERHLTHIHHHVQPILDPRYGFEDHTYRMGSVDPFDPRKVADIERSFINSVIEDQILANQHRYHVDAQHLCPRIQSIDLPDIEKHSTVVHNYHIIQPVIINSDPRFQATTTITTSSNIASAHGPNSGEDIKDKTAVQLKKMINELKEENQKLIDRLKYRRSSEV